MGSQYSGVDFSFLYVKDMSEKDAINTIVSSDDNLPRLNVWMLQDPEKADLLKLVLKPDMLEYMSAMIVLDLDQPWEMMNALNKWMGLLSEVILNMMKTLPLQTQDQIKERLASHIKNFEIDTSPEVIKEDGKKS